MASDGYELGRIVFLRGDVKCSVRLYLAQGDGGLASNCYELGRILFLVGWAMWREIESREGWRGLDRIHANVRELFLRVNCWVR